MPLLSGRFSEALTKKPLLKSSRAGTPAARTRLDSSRGRKRSGRLHDKQPGDVGCSGRSSMRLISALGKG
jgi:hypothetical protein